MLKNKQNSKNPGKNQTKAKQPIKVKETNEKRNYLETKKKQKENETKII